MIRTMSFGMWEWLLLGGRSGSVCFGRVSRRFENKRHVKGLSVNGHPLVNVKSFFIRFRSHLNSFHVTLFSNILFIFKRFFDSSHTSLYFVLWRLPFFPKHSFYLAFFSKKTPVFLKFPRKDASVHVAAKAEESAGTARPMWNGGRKWRQPLTCKLERGTGSPDFSGRRNTSCYACRSCFFAI